MCAFCLLIWWAFLALVSCAAFFVCICQRLHLNVVFVIVIGLMFVSVGTSRRDLWSAARHRVLAAVGACF